MAGWVEGSKTGSGKGEEMSLSIVVTVDCRRLENQAADEKSDAKPAFHVLAEENRRLACWEFRSSEKVKRKAVKVSGIEKLRQKTGKWIQMPLFG
jgi:hypothetical protein